MARKGAAPPVDRWTTPVAEALKVARKAVADQQKIAFTMVCATDLLARVAEFKPTTLKQLADVDDFGPTRAERYGEPLPSACVPIWRSLRRRAVAKAVSRTPEAAVAGAAGAAGAGQGEPRRSRPPPQGAAPAARERT